VRPYVWCLIHQFVERLWVVTFLFSLSVTRHWKKSLFVRWNILISRFKYCSWQVKVKLFQTYCLCLYNPGLWHSFNKATMHRFYSRYNKCVTRFFGFAKYISLTSALLLTGLPSCATVIHNFNFRFRIFISTSTNVIVKSFECVWVFLSVCLSLCSFFCVLYLFLWTSCLSQLNEMKWK